MEFRFSEYFERQVLRKRPYLQKAWCIAVVENPVRSEHKVTIDFASGAEFRNWAGAT